jgi:peptidoglycan/LPS O-acetylase OafA/YrhL
MTFQDRINASGGKPSGFDYMRLILALSVIGFHSIVTGYGSEAQRDFVGTPFGRIFLLVLPMFFALSGFLVAGSLERSKGLVTFLGLRAFRIFPALMVDTLFCGLVIGLFFTTLPWYQYLLHEDFLRYLGNAVGVVHFYLPGVFEGNPSNQVNGQLWTVPLEMECYILIAAFAVFGAHQSPRLFALMVLVLAMGLEARSLLTGLSPWVGRNLTLCFLAGIALYLNRATVRWSAALFVLSVLMFFWSVQDVKWLYLSPWPAAYATAYLGLTNPRRIGVINWGDYSYGLFLYGYPIQQALVQVLPEARYWVVNIMLAVPLTFAFAAMSWHFIEKPIMNRKGVLKKLQAMVPRNPFVGILGQPGRRS